MIDEGKDLHRELKNAGFWLAQQVYQDPVNKISNLDALVKKFSGRLFNYIHNNRKIEFILYLQKIYAGISVQPNARLLDILKENDNQIFKEYALAFMMGFLSGNKKSEETRRKE